MKKLIVLKNSFFASQLFFVLSFFILISYNNLIYAHCDSIEGPVVKACQKALETGNINYVLVWVQEADEHVIRDSFDKTLKVRTLSEDAKDLADMYFFETVVRIHRQGEGEPYSGLKPVGYEIPHGIKAADLAIESGSIEEIISEQPAELHPKITELFEEVKGKLNYEVDDVKAGREYVKAYVHFIHFIEGLYGETEHPELHHH